MFGVISKREDDVKPLAHVMAFAGLRNHDDAWLVTNELSLEHLSDQEKRRSVMSLVCAQKPLLCKEAALVHEGRVFDELEPGLQGRDLQTRVQELLAKTDGEYCLAATDGDQIIVARDCLGRRPVFFGQNDSIAAFASEKKALWAVGIRDVKPLRAGMMASLSHRDVTVSEGHRMKRPANHLDNFETVVGSYQQYLIGAFEKRLKGAKRVGVLLSGGVDSTLSSQLTFRLIKETDCDVVAYSAGTENAVDLAYAERFARQMGLPHRVARLELDDVDTYIPKVIRAVEERDFVQVEAGIGVYAAEEMAADDGMQIIVSGQGPDELWGGYRWYPRLIKEEGYEGFFDRSWEDLERADIETLDRENRIAASHGLEVLFPYVDTCIVELAMHTSPQLKIHSPQDPMGKRPHREVAKKMGVPEEFSNREKDAAQHGTGIHDFLDEIARKNGFDLELVQRVDYQSAQVSTEYLSSSARYGYRYAEKGLWEIDEHVQFFIDSVAYKQELLNGEERERIGQFLSRI